MKLPINQILCGDCIEVMKIFPDESIDCIVTDPPYGIGFMGKEWDKALPPEEAFKQMFRVLKPGALAFVMSSPRQDVLWRMLRMLEDCGFQLRQSFVSWIYKSGFPKAYDVSKGIDKRNRRHIQYVDFGKYLVKKRKEKGLSKNDIDRSLGTNTAYSWWEGRKSGVQLPSKEYYLKLKEMLGLDNRFDELIERYEAQREVVGKGKAGLGKGKPAHNGGFKPNYNLTAPSLIEAKKWQGWKSITGLKPALECVLMVNKPLREKTIVDNVLKYGTGAINVDACRIPSEESIEQGRKGRTTDGGYHKKYGAIELPNIQGRFPANLLVSDRALNTGKISGSGKFTKKKRPRLESWRIAENRNDRLGQVEAIDNYGDVGDQSRFFDLDAWAEHHGFDCGYSGSKDKVLSKIWNDFLDAHGEDVDAAYLWDCMRETIRILRPDLYKLSLILDVAKASKSERDKGLDRMREKELYRAGHGNKEDDDVTKRFRRQAKNFHPTVKPIKLMAYLIELGCPRQGIVLDPFVGTGTTCIAAQRLRRKWIGIEIKNEYVQIAAARTQSPKGLESFFV